MLAIVLLLPVLFWDKGPEAADQLKQAGITEVAVPASLESAWKGVAGLSIRVADSQSAVKLPAPGVQYRQNQAGPTRSPWIDSNGWRILRQPAARFHYNAPGPAVAPAAAEAFMYGENAMIQTDAAGLEPLRQMLAFLGALKAAEMPTLADIGFVDDGSPQAGEVMNLMVRRNLMFKIVDKPDPRLKLNVRSVRATDPSAFAQKVRFDLTDEKRSLRIYGSEVVIGRLTGDGERVRVQLLNYAAAARPLRGLRVRVLGRYPKYELSVFGIPDAKLVDYEVLPDATEFTVQDMKSFAVIDLSK